MSSVKRTMPLACTIVAGALLMGISPAQASTPQGLQAPRAAASLTLTPSSHDIANPLDRTTRSDIMSDSRLSKQEKKRCARVLRRLQKSERAFFAFSKSPGNGAQARDASFGMHPSPLFRWQSVAQRYLRLSSLCPWENAPRIPAFGGKASGLGLIDEASLPYTKYAPTVAHTYPEIRSLLEKSELPKDVQAKAMRLFTQNAGGNVFGDYDGNSAFLLDVRSTNRPDIVQYTFQFLGSKEIHSSYIDPSWDGTWLDLFLDDFSQSLEANPTRVSYSRNSSGALTACAETPKVTSSGNPAMFCASYA